VIIQLIASLLSLLDNLTGWLEGERLRRLGRLEAETEQLKESARASEIAAGIDRGPAVTDRDELLERLQGPSKR
jgi:hypothetical protein